MVIQVLGPGMFKHGQKLYKFESHHFNKTIYYHCRLSDVKSVSPPPEAKSINEDDNGSRIFGRYGSFSSLKRYTSKSSLISAYDFIKEKVVPDSMRKKPEQTKLRLVVGFFFLVIVLVISLAQILYIQHKGEVSLHIYFFRLL